MISAKTILALSLFFLSSCASAPVPPPAPPPFKVAELPASIDGSPVMVLSQALRNSRKPQILEVQVIPGRGMEIYQIRAHIPGIGVVNLLDPSGGGAILIPYANRIRGSFDSEKNEIETSIDGQTVSLPANAKGKQPGAEPHALDGLVLHRSFATTSDATPEQATLTGLLQSENFGGHWPGTADIAVTAALKRGSFSLAIIVKNSGNESLPIALGWNPHFNVPSRKREQARLRIPARARLAMNNYDDVFPTGKILRTLGTAYDFDSLQGRPLAHGYLDDCFTELDRDSEDQAVAELIDPSAHYGLRLKAITPEIKAFQVYAPVDENFVAIGPQYNLGDPFNPMWRETRRDSGVLRLQPGETARYAVELELFSPSR